MKNTLLVDKIKTRISDEEFEELITLLKSDPQSLVDDLTASPEDPIESFLYGLDLTLQRSLNSQAIAGGYEEITLVTDTYFHKHVQALSEFSIKEIETILFRLLDSPGYFGGSFIVYHLMDHLKALLDKNDFALLAANENLPYETTTN